VVNGVFAILELRRRGFRRRRVLMQIGPGASVLTANNSYRGEATASAGKLVVRGSIAIRL
jgi:autotransporter-associated beta strand protein